MREGRLSKRVCDSAGRGSSAWTSGLSARTQPARKPIALRPQRVLVPRIVGRSNPGVIGLHSGGKVEKEGESEIASLVSTAISLELRQDDRSELQRAEPTPAVPGDHRRRSARHPPRSQLRQTDPASL